MRHANLHERTRSNSRRAGFSTHGESTKSTPHHTESETSISEDTQNIRLSTFRKSGPSRRLSVGSPAGLDKSQDGGLVVIIQLIKAIGFYTNHISRQSMEDSREVERRTRSGYKRDQGSSAAGCRDTPVTAGGFGGESAHE